MKTIMMDSETKKLVDFLLEIDKLKSVKRTIYKSGGGHETTPEHVWHMCMYAMLLCGKNINMLKLMKIILVHDLVEVYAGDASVWDEKARKDKKSKEDEAAKKLFEMLPPHHKEEFALLWNEFEECKTSEARMAKTIDGLQAVGQQISSGGRAWKEQGVTLEMLKEKAKNYRKEKSVDDIWEEFFRVSNERKLFSDE